MGSMVGARKFATCEENKAHWWNNTQLNLYVKWNFIFRREKGIISYLNIQSLTVMEETVHFCLRSFNSVTYRPDWFHVKLFFTNIFCEPQHSHFWEMIPELRKMDTFYDKSKDKGIFGWILGKFVDLWGCEQFSRCIEKKCHQEPLVACQERQPEHETVTYARPYTLPSRV